LANDTTLQDLMPVRLRRYPNHRYYDAVPSQCVTREDIFQLIGDGHQVQVNDFKSSEDITVRVRTQLILEQAPGKLASLSAELLQQIIRSNESLLREFVDKCFFRALSSFIESQRELDRYLDRSLGLSNEGQNPRGALPSQSFPFLAPNWAAMMMGPFAQALLAGGADTPSVEPVPDRSDEHSDVRKAVEELKQEVDTLRNELQKC